MTSWISKSFIPHNECFFYVFKSAILYNLVIYYIYERQMTPSIFFFIDYRDIKGDCNNLFLVEFRYSSVHFYIISCLLLWNHQCSWGINVHGFHGYPKERIYKRLIFIKITPITLPTILRPPKTRKILAPTKFDSHE